MFQRDNDDNAVVTGVVLSAQSSREVSLSGADLQERFSNPAVAYLMGLGSKRSRQTMMSFLNKVARMFGHEDLRSCDWSSMRRHDVQAVMEALSESDKAPTTINTYLSALKGVAHEAWTQKQIDTDTFQHIKQIKSVKGTRLAKGRALEPEEIEALFAACAADSGVKGVRDAALLSVLIGCGLRRAELVSLDMEHLIQSRRKLRVRGKGDKERKAFMPEKTRECVITWIDEVRGDHPGPLFPRVRRHGDVTETRMSTQAIYHILDCRRKEAGIDKFAPHDLRRTYASMLLDNGEDIVTVRDLMGHASIATTQKYDRRGEDRLAEASQRLKF